MMTPNNYCTHAIEALKGLNVPLAAKMYDADLSLLHSFVRETQHLLFHAEKFLLPEWGRIFEKDEWELMAEVPVVGRLPFPIIAIEFACDYGKYNTMIEGETACSKRIALAVETDILNDCPSLSALLKLRPQELQGDGFVVMPVSYADEIDVWTPAPAAIYFSAEQDPRDGGNLFFTPLGRGAYAPFPEHERMKRAMRDCTDEVFAVLHLLVALGLEKGKHDLLPDHSTIPAPEKLNKKRARNQRAPFFSYRVLDIVADVMATPAQISGRPKGVHASPRMHKRRGHLRRLSEGRVIWVRNTIVGKPGRGRVEKDYRLKGSQ